MIKEARFSEGSGNGVLDRVRETTEFVVSKAKHVKLHSDRIAEFCQRLSPVDIVKAYKYQGDFYFRGSDETSLVDYTFTLNALNFGSGLSSQWKDKRKKSGSSFKHIAQGLKDYAEAGSPLGSEFAQQVTEDQLSSIIGIAPSMEIIPMFKKSLNELGDFTVSAFGSYSNLLSSLDSQKRGELLATTLLTNLPCYADVAEYHGEKIYLLKRAQILANDLYLAFQGFGPGDIKDVNRLTMFADNLLPHVFRVEGILEYDKALLDRINNGEAISKDSEEEIEIRATAVQVVEIMRQMFRAKIPNIFSAQIDWFLWEYAQQPKYKSLPRHRTATYFY